MASIHEHFTRGRVKEVHDDHVVFEPAGTNYLLHLRTASRYDGPVNTPMDALVTATARKVYTVSSGGNFIAPIFGPPRTIQGRVLALDERHVVVRAGARIVVTLPAELHAIDLNSGALAPGGMVNVVALPGAAFAPAPAAVPG